MYFMYKVFQLQSRLKITALNNKYQTKLHLVKIMLIDTLKIYLNQLFLKYAI